MLDYLEIFREFNSQDINYIVCGGLAVNLNGIPRMTYVIDLLLEMEDENIRKYIKLVKKWSFSPKQPVNIEDFSDLEKRNNWINEKSMRAFKVDNEDWAISEIDVLIDTSVNYEEAEKNKIIRSFGDVQIPLISVKDLIKMKKNTNRKQDEADIRYLKEKLKIKEKKQKKGFDYYLEPEILEDYKNKPLKKKLQWLYAGNKLRMKSPEQVKRKHEKYRKAEI